MTYERSHGRGPVVGRSPADFAGGAHLLEEGPPHAQLRLEGGSGQCRLVGI